MTEPQLASLPIATLRNVDAACLRYENGAELGPTVMAAFLQGIDGDERKLLLRELLLLDCEMRSQRGEAVRCEDYAIFNVVQDEQIVEQAFREWKNQPADGSALPSSDRYVFEREIGRGGIGTVWRVYDRVSMRPLAIKLLRERFAGKNRENSRGIPVACRE